MWLRIQCNGVFKTLILAVCITSLARRSSAQCTGPLQSSMQSTTITTAGNNPQLMPFSQYNPPANYMLVSAVITSVATIDATVQMTNNGITDIALAKLSLSDEDVFEVNGHYVNDQFGNISDTVINKNNVYIGPIAMGQTVTYGPATPWSSQGIFNDSIPSSNSAFSYFKGGSSLNMYYTSYPGFGVGGGSPTITPNFTITNNITLTYYFCYTGVLAADILSFTAVKDGSQVDLAWLTANETPGRTYTVQISYGNGTDFTDLVTIPAIGSSTDAAYSNTYQIKPTDQGQLYFRLKMVDVGGAVAYSPMRIINLSTGSTGTNFSIYPNPPTDYVQVSLPGSVGSWQIDILSADGMLVQRNTCSNTSLAQINFNRKLAAGAYFVRAFNSLNGEKHSGSFVIQQ